MPYTPQQADAAIREGVAAMQRRDAKAARAGFERLVAPDAGIEPPWLLLAQACRLDGDAAAEEAAVDALLALHPRHVRGLVMKGDRRAAANDSRAATAFYDSALRAAARLETVPPGLQPELARIAAALEHYGAGHEDHLHRQLAAAGFGVERLSGRMREALEIVGGRAQVQLQQPTSFYFPGLPQRAFYEREMFDWVPAVEAATDAIRAELRAVLDGGTVFPPYIEADPSRPGRNHSLLGKHDWGAFHLWRGGAIVPENAARCPATMAALAVAPIPCIAARSPMALFSLLKPGTHIPPHHGMLNTRLICHLPLIVPPGCRFRVGNEVREWEEGKLLIFDDSMEHEAYNDSAETRVILLFEIWRPELTADERAAMTVLYEAIGAVSE